MSYSRRILSITLLVALLLSAVRPVLAQESAPNMAPYTARVDAPTFGVRGPYAVGVSDLVIEPEGGDGRSIPVTIWYPALNPDALTEDETYVLDFEEPNMPNFAIAGRALRDADPDTSGGPYPLIVYSHGYWLFRQVSVFLTEQLASWGFVVIAGDHADNWRTIFGESQVEDYVTRPQDVSRKIDFAEALTESEGALPGLIDLEHVGVIGHSFGADTTLLMGGARLNTDLFINEWCTMHPGDPDDPLNDCAAMPEKLDEMADLAGLDEVPEGLWPDWSDPRVDAVAPLAPGPQYFGPQGLATIDVPILYLESELDWAQGLASAYYEPYAAMPSDLKSHVMFERGDHGLYLNDCDAMPAWIDFGFDMFCWDQVWSTDRAHDLINHFVTAFMLAELKGDADAAAALAPDAVDFRGVNYQTGRYGSVADVAAPAPLQVRHALAAVNDIIMYYEIAGQGDPVLLLPGGTMCVDAWAWTNIYETLGPHFTIIAPDSRAQGRSTDSAQPLTYQIMADDAVALLDHLNIDSAHVVGWSDGAITGLDMAIRYPERVLSLVLTGAQNGVDGLTEEAYEEQQAYSIDTLDEGTREFLDFCYLSIAPDPDHLPVMIDKIREMWLQPEFFAADGLADIAVPALFLEGTTSDLVRVDHIEELAEAVPTSRIQWIEGTGHFAPMEKADEWSAYVLKFLQTAE